MYLLDDRVSMYLLLDIEGTITNRSGYGTGPQLIRALASIEERGIPTIFCSGRDLKYMTNLRKRWGLEPLKGAIAENGCIIAPYPHGIEGARPDPRAREMDRDEIMKRIEMLHGYVEIDPFKSYIFSIYVPGYMDGMRYTQEQIMEIHSFLTDSLEGIQCQIVPTSASVEIIPKGVDKGTGIRKYCELSDTDLSDIIFVCDSNNDLPGAEVVKKGGGLVGVVDNGEKELKKIADQVSDKEHWKGALDLFSRFDLV